MEKIFLLRIVEGGKVALYKVGDQTTPEMLRPRPDWYQYEGGYAWGYSGSGVFNLAYAILGKWEDEEILANDIVEKVLSKLDGEHEHTLTESQIRILLST